MDCGGGEAVGSALCCVWLGKEETESESDKIEARESSRVGVEAAAHVTREEQGSSDLGVKREICVAHVGECLSRFGFP